jgi:hypothetical protein
MRSEFNLHNGKPPKDLKFKYLKNVAKKVNEFSIVERKFIEANRDLKHHKKGLQI